jgi:MraZ protein
VTSSLQKYTGFHPYKIDPKNRVSIPPQWRPEPGATLFLQLSKGHGMPVIKVLSEEAFNERVETVKASGLNPAQQSAKLGSLAMLCRTATINEQGKLLVPKDLIDQAGIRPGSEIRLAGRGLHFEIWNAENFERVLEIETNQEDDDELGIF